MVSIESWRDQQAWSLLEQVGAGAFSAVYAAQHVRTGEAAVVKVLSKLQEGNTEDILRNEADVLWYVVSKLPGHPNLMLLKAAFEDDQNVYLVLDKCHGLQLAQTLKCCKRYPELHAAWIVRQIASALRDLHNINVIHRDIKPENILHVNNNLFSPVKIIDFGLSTKLPLQAAQKEVMGSYNYVAPEVLRFQEYTPACDIWSLGVITYQLLCGKYPFTNELQIKMAPLPFYEDEWQTISADAKDFVKRLLVKEHNRRPTAETVLKHRWLTQLDDKPLFKAGSAPVTIPASKQQDSVGAGGENMSPNCKIQQRQGIAQMPNCQSLLST